MRDWAIYIEAWAPEGKPGSIDVSDSRVSDFADMLAPFGAVTSVDHFRWAVQITIAADTALDAAQSGTTTTLVAASQCRFPDWPIERLEVVDVDRRDAELAMSNFPDLVGTTEVADLLGVSRQRIHELRKAGRFPQPMVELSGVPIWLRAAIVAFDEGWERKVGRPRAIAQDVDMAGILGSGQQGVQHPEHG